MSSIKRGDIFFVDYAAGESPRNHDHYSGQVGSEQHMGRPAVIVSNDLGNKFSSVVEVVYLTSRVKNQLPTHVIIRGPKKMSTVLCEQVDSVSIERLGTYYGRLSDREMKRVNIALAISLGLVPVGFKPKEVRRQSVTMEEIG